VTTKRDSDRKGKPKARKRAKLKKETLKDLEVGNPENVKGGSYWAACPGSQNRALCN
jgi:hypothetical protein